MHKEAHKQLPIPEGREAIREGFKQQNVPSISELIEIAQEMDVKFIVCQMTMDVMNMTKDEFVEGIEVAGAASFIHFASDADISLTF